MNRMTGARRLRAIRQDDPAIEEAVYKSVSMCEFAGIGPGPDPVVGRDQVCKFRHVLERHNFQASSPDITRA